MDNQNKRPFLLLLVVVGFLLAFGRYVPEKIGDYDVISINLLSDICTSEADDSLAIQLATLPEIKKEEVVEEKPIIKLDVPEGVKPIDDYSDSTHFGMKHFYEALRNIDDMNRPVRIAYFGDSFIEGDIYTADLRAMLQDKFGGNGIGFTDIASPFAEFRVTLPTHFSGWDTRNASMRDSCSRHRLGPTQRYAMPRGKASSTLNATTHYKHLDHFDTSTLYVRSDTPVFVKACINKDSVITFMTDGDGSIETIRCEHRMNSIEWTVEGNSSVTCFGTALEGRKGISLDNFSFRGSSGMNLTHIPQQQWNAISAARSYDLIVLHFGLNVAAKDVLKYDYYLRGMKHTIDVLKQAFPHSSFLIIGSSDREDRIEGELHTMPGVKALIKYQEVIASNNNVAFWNLYEAMGGEGSIVKMTQTKPKEARLDYTHITREGGKTLAEIFYNSLMFSYEQYLVNN